LFIKSTLGFTMDTLPEGLLNIMTSIDLGTDNTIQVGIEDANLEAAREILSDSYTGFVSFQTTGNSVVVEVAAEPAEQQDQVIEDGPGEDYDRAEVAQPRAEAIRMDTRHLGEAAAGVQQANPAEMATQVEAPRNTMIEPSEITEVRVEDNTRVYSVIAQAVGDESINIARQLQDALAKFDQNFSKAIALKRQVEEATQKFSENSPAIISLVEQASALVVNYELVDEVYFTERELVFITSSLITDDRWDGHRRLIGRMRIGVSLEALFSPNPTSRDRSISIKNLTHRYVTNSGRVWECGHIDTTGSTCFGTAFNAIFDAIVSRDLTYIVESLIRFIKTPNPNDAWGSHLKYWPVDPTEQPEVQGDQ